MNGSTGAGCWTTGPGSSPEMEPPSYDLTATERALRRERIRRTADVAGRVVSPTMLDIITDMGSYPRQWASIDLAIAADRAAHACWHGTWEQAEAWLDVFAWALAGLLNMHRDAIATDITVVKGEAHGDIVMRDQRVMIVTAELSIGVLAVRIGYGGVSAALDDGYNRQRTKETAWQTSRQPRLSVP